MPFTESIDAIEKKMGVKLEIYLLSFGGVYQNFEVITGLKFTNISVFSKWLNLKGTWHFYSLLICFNLGKTPPFSQRKKTRHSKGKFPKHPFLANKKPNIG